MKAIKTGDPEKKKKRREKRAAKKGSLQSTPVFASSNDGLKGSCEADNLRACKTEVKKTPKFNPNKRRISKSRLVGSAKKREKADKRAARKAIRSAKNKNTPYSSPRFL